MDKSRKEVTADYLAKVRSAFECRDGGLFYIEPGSGRTVGRRYGSATKEGYRYGAFQGITVTEHRLVWLYHHGQWPISLDHINGVRDDNRLENLREAGMSENMQNMGVMTRNKSGFIGVSFEAKRGLWTAGIYANGKSHRLGRFGTPEEAAAAYKAAKALLHSFNPEPVTRKGHTG